jgi:FKBP-type peptidyl-prolyl cis-trans isomerase
MASGIKIEDLVIGTGPQVERGQAVTIRWRGLLNRGDEFGNGEVSFVAGSRQVILGLSRGVIGMRVGGVRRIRVSPHLGYRDRGAGGMPANAVMVFEVKLLGIDNVSSE